MLHIINDTTLMVTIFLLCHPPLEVLPGSVSAVDLMHMGLLWCTGGLVLSLRLEAPGHHWNV